MKKSNLLNKSIALMGMSTFLSGCGAAIVGGVGTVGMSAVEDRGIGGVFSDQSLHLRLSYELADIPGVEATVYRGCVLLTGVVYSKEFKEEAVRLTQKVSGVKKVIDRLQVTGKDGLGLGEYTRDGWITTKLKALLYSDEDVIAPNYLIKTADKVIYIFGTAQTKEEMDRVIEQASDITGVRKVVNLIQVKKTPPVKVKL